MTSRVSCDIIDAANKISQIYIPQEVFRMNTNDIQNIIHELVMLILKNKDLSGMTTAEVVMLYHETIKEVRESWAESVKAVNPGKPAVISRPF